MESLTVTLVAMVDTVGRFPVYFEQTERWILVLLSVVSTGLAVGTVTRHDDMGGTARVLVCVVIFLVVFALGFLLAKATPFMLQVAQGARTFSP